MSDLPEGYTIKRQGAAPAAAPAGLPEGYALKGATPKPAESERGIGESLWEGLKSFTGGVAGGLAGKGVPEGRASEFEGGRSGFGGRMLGAATRSVGEGLWEALKTPGEYLSGEKQPDPRAGAPRSTAEALGPAMLMAGQGFRAPMVTPRATESAAAPLLALPPPKVTAAGQPATQTGITPRQLNVSRGAELLEQGGPALQTALERQRPGIIPPGPASTMTAPSATPMMGQPARPAPAAPAPPLVDAVPTSPLADAIAKNDGSTIDKHLTQTYRGAVKPKPLGTPGGVAGLTEQDRRITTAVDTILANKPTLRVTDATTGEKIPLPRRPNLPQFAEALDHTKRDIFRLYDDMASRGQAQGVRIDLAPVVAKAREIEQSTIAQDLSPTAKGEAARLASIMEARSSYTPLQAQEMIEGINQISKSFHSRGGELRDTTAVGVLNQLAQVLRDQLDRAISTQGGPAYQALKNRYGAIRSVEQEVATAVMKMANKPEGGFPYHFADLFSAEQFVHGILDPTNFPRRATGAASTLIGKQLVKYLREPNRAIGRMFDRREQMTTRAPYQPGRLSGTPGSPYNMGTGGGSVAGPYEFGARAGFPALQERDRQRQIRRQIVPGP